ncbi:uncharacterized protein BO80DRAFT_422693 [Aspergillus ibericus CBS 121593]|uniref:Uncharacterized protein n=1 Tax=Aspergillus ibericus CBS 121593 TaxID=1448316 RepID=A0A395HA38_9EURO|nr:hypothetical protein BO80DRAFT_422693 [Aspergillus ibericus CBS 121593]RAL03768.1 hypothetical protein BO80DRAFT_422693 [Aspergillus ibericus CBS 121593]
MLVSSPGYASERSASSAAIATPERSGSVDREDNWVVRSCPETWRPGKSRAPPPRAAYLHGSPPSFSCIGSASIRRTDSFGPVAPPEQAVGSGYWSLLLVPTLLGGAFALWVSVNLLMILFYFIFVSFPC